MTRLLRTGLPAILAALMALIVAARAEAPALHRGINFELWQSWTGRSAFLSESYDRANFPDWMDHVDDVQLAALRRQGFDFVRLNIDPSPFFWDAGEADLLAARAVKAAERLQAVGFAVIVDLHLVPDMDDRPDGLHAVLGTAGYGDSGGFSRYLELVARMAQALAPLPAERTLLELMNEPDQDWFSPLPLLDRWPGQLAALYKAARGTAPALPLVLTGARGGGIDGLLRLDPARYGDDDNVIWSFHLYEPYAITHSGLPWERNAAHFLTGLPFPASALDDALAARLLADADRRINAEIADPAARDKLKAEVGDRLASYRASGMGAEKLKAEVDRIAAWAKRHAIPPGRVLMGEFGVFQDHVALKTRAAIIAATRKAAEADGFAWAIYTAGITGAGRSFSVIGDPKTFAIEPAIASALGLAPSQSP